MQDFIPRALAITVQTEKITQAVTDLLNEGWRVVSANKRTLTASTLIAIPPTDCRDEIACDMRRRRLEVAYGI